MNQIEIYQTKDKQIEIEVMLENETVWLTQEQMSLLFDKARSTVNEHIKNIYSENELVEDGTKRKFGNPEFSDKPTSDLLQADIPLPQKSVLYFL
ncbi:MAG TPA: hypothetical protein VI548_00010 [Chitinophagaceae bacterium]|nr:hypothetical protein [Chitinophagaceae bacterium]